MYPFPTPIRLILGIGLCIVFSNLTPAAENISLANKIEGLLIGSAIGDAAGGPVEFVSPPARSKWTTEKRPITPEGISDLGKLFRLSSYSTATALFPKTLGKPPWNPSMENSLERLS